MKTNTLCPVCHEPITADETQVWCSNHLCYSETADIGTDINPGETAESAAQRLAQAIQRKPLNWKQGMTD